MAYESHFVCRKCGATVQVVEVGKVWMCPNCGRLGFFDVKKVHMFSHPADGEPKSQSSYPSEPITPPRPPSPAPPPVESKGCWLLSKRWIAIGAIVVLGLVWTGCAILLLPNFVEEVWQLILFLAIELLYLLVVAPFIWRLFFRRENVFQPRVRAYKEGGCLKKSGWFLLALFLVALVIFILVVLGMATAGTL